MALSGHEYKSTSFGRAIIMQFAILFDAMLMLFHQIRRHLHKQKTTYRAFDAIGQDHVDGDGPGFA